MNFCGIISEFNPFHNGHEYIIAEAKRRTGLKVICLMSGDFVQRGTPAVTDKYERAKMAVTSGANAVIELPTIYACSNAENFATGGVKILKALGVTKLAFGVEGASLEILQRIAKIKFENSEHFSQSFKNEIENGINFNTAMKRAIIKELGEDVSELLNKPNNVLAIEYLTAILKLDAKIEPVLIERCDGGFLSTKETGNFLSASGIRELIENGKDFAKFVPKYAKPAKIFTKIEENCLKNMITYKIRSSLPSELENCYDYTEGIEFRVKKCADEFPSYDEILNEISTPRYKAQRVQKLLLYPLLNITKRTVELSYKIKPAVKVLAIEKSDKELLTCFNKSKISLIVTNADFEKLSSKQKKVAGIDLNASNIYNLILGRPNNMDKKTGTMFI